MAAARGENRESLKRYKGENGILSAKTVIFGGEFRVTTVIPFKGNFAEYHHLEIAKPVSLVGKALSHRTRQAGRLPSSSLNSNHVDCLKRSPSLMLTIRLRRASTNSNRRLMRHQRNRMKSIELNLLVRR